MNRTIPIILFVILALSLPFSYGGCVLVFTTGDVKKEKNPDVGEPSTDFGGSTSPAIIDSANALDLSDGAFAGGITRMEAISAGFTQQPMATPVGAFWPLRLPMVLKDSLQKVEIPDSASTFFKSAVDTRSGIFPGSCGGRFSYSIDFIRNTKAFDGSILFENYCDHGIALSGETDLDGTYEADSEDFTAANFNFASLTDGHITLKGEISLDFLHQPIVATLSAYRSGIASGLVYWLKDYSMNITEFAGFIEIEIFGTFYHPDHGYVDLTTLEPFIVHHEDDWPTSGRLIIKGENNTQAILSALDHVTCSVFADTDGDRGFDWESGILNWTDM
jgi:hypothetical protein